MPIIRPFAIYENQAIYDKLQAAAAHAPKAARLLAGMESMKHHHEWRVKNPLHRAIAKAGAYWRVAYNLRGHRVDIYSEDPDFDYRKYMPDFYQPEEGEIIIGNYLIVDFESTAYAAQSYARNLFEYDILHGYIPLSGHSSEQLARIRDLICRLHDAGYTCQRIEIGTKTLLKLLWLDYGVRTPQTLPLPPLQTTETKPIKKYNKKKPATIETINEQDLSAITFPHTFNEDPQND